MKSVSNTDPVPESSATQSSAPNGARLTSVAPGAAGAAAQSVHDPLISVGRAAPRPMPETVIGDDDRTRVPDSSATPWRRICQLDLKGPRGTFKGTGWIAGPATVVTAGHCVHYQPFFRGWADEIIVSPGRNDDLRPVAPQTATRFSTPDIWRDRSDRDHDIGCIHLETPIGDETGIFAFGVLPDAELLGLHVNIAGYPTDLDKARVQYHHASAIGATTERRLFYDVDTVAGQSGAPVFVQQHPDAPPLVVGVHAYGTPGTPAEMNLVANSAPRLNHDIFALISGWVADDNARLGLS